MKKEQAGNHDLNIVKKKTVLKIDFTYNQIYNFLFSTRPLIVPALLKADTLLFYRRPNE